MLVDGVQAMNKRARDEQEENSQDSSSKKICIEKTDTHEDSQDSFSEESSEDLFWTFNNESNIDILLDLIPKLGDDCAEIHSG